MKRIFLSFCCILIFSFAVYADESLIQIKQKLEKIERDITDLQKILFTKKDNQLSDNNDIQIKNNEKVIFINTGKCKVWMINSIKKLYQVKKVEIL